MRQQIFTGLPFSVIAEEVPMGNKTWYISLKPMVRFADLPELVHHHLNEHKKAGTPCWHRKKHEAEMWIKLGGDHGCGSFKLSFQIGNVKQPNSVKNQYHFWNLLQRILQQSCHCFAALCRSGGAVKNRKLAGQESESHLFGDYGLLHSCYGLSGPSGARPCLFCLVAIFPASQICTTTTRGSHS